MPSTYTLNNGIELIATGEQSGTWGDTTNTNLSLLDTALDGQVTVTLPSAGTSGSPNTLAISDGAASDGRNRMVIFNDGADLTATAYVQLTPNDAEKIIYVRNDLSGSRSIILFQGTYNASNDYEVPAGTTAVIYFNGAGSGAVAANVFNNAYFDSLRLGSVSVTAIIDDDTMATASATNIATSESIKAYVDTQVGANNELSEVLANGNTTGGTSISVNSTDNITFSDSSKAIFGAGSDLQIYHDGSASRIVDAGTGGLVLQADANTSITSADGATVSGRFRPATHVSLYYNGAEKLATTSTGIDVTGSGVFSNSTDVAQSFAEFGRTPFSTHGSFLVSGTATGHLTTNTDASGNSTVSVGATRVGLGNGELDFYKSGNTAAGAARTFSRTMGIASNGDITFYDTNGNASFVYDESAGSVFNEQGDNKDFRVESDTNTHALFVDAGNNNVLIGGSAIDQAGSFGYRTSNDDIRHVRVSGSAGDTLIAAVSGVSNGFQITDDASNNRTYKFHNVGAQSFFLGMTEAAFNEGGNDRDFRVESDNQSNMFVVDAGENKVGFGRSPLGGGSGNTANEGAIQIADGLGTVPLFINGGADYAGMKLKRDGTNSAGGTDGWNWTIRPSYASGVASGGDISYLKINSVYDVNQGGQLQHEVVINEDQYNLDFRVESDGDPNAIFMNAGNGTTAFGTTSDNYASSTNEGIYLNPGSSSSFSANSPVLRLNRMGTGGNNRSNLEFYNNGTLRGFFGSLGTEGGMYLGSGAGVTTNMTLYEDETVVNEDSVDLDFRVESDSNANMFKVDALDNTVGIGVAPGTNYRTLTIDNGGNTTGVVINGGNAGLYLGTSATGGFGSNAAIARAQIAGYHTGGSEVGDLVIGNEYQKSMLFANTSNASGGLTTRMKIDQFGRVTIPSQPMVFVTRTSSQSVSNDENNPTTLDFTSEIFDINNNFNLTNDRFTAPVTGRYEISWSYGTNVISNSVYRTFIWKNGAKLTYTQLRNDSNGTTGYVFGSRTAILPLNANDYIELRASTDNGTSFYADSNLRICMTIRLIG